MKTTRSRQTRRRGLSLVEVMVVIAITLTLTSLLGMGVLRTWRQSRVDTTRLTLQRTAQDVVIHEARTGRAPDALEAIYRGEPVPRDAWGSQILLERPPHSWDLVSLGEDRAEGGSGFDADLRYSEQ